MRKGIIAFYAAATAMSSVATYVPICSADTVNPHQSHSTPPNQSVPPSESAPAIEAMGLGAVTIDLQRELGIKCTAGGAYQLIVDQVIAGTKAQHAEIQPGDKILDARVSADRVAFYIQHGAESRDVEIERGPEHPGSITSGKLASGALPYPLTEQPQGGASPQKGQVSDTGQRKPQQGFVSSTGQPAPQQGQVNGNSTTLPGHVSQNGVPSAPQRLLPMNARTANQPFSLNANKFEAAANQNRPVLKVGLTDNELRLLANYNIELIVDHSMSMRRPDCPGGLSRWNWCGQQAFNMASALSPYVPNGLTITTFAGNHEVYPHVGAQSIVSIFNSTGLEKGTRLGEALEDRFADYFNHRNPHTKPLLIAIITDGVPWPQYEPKMVVQELINASKAMRDSKEVTVAVLQIGGRDQVGREFVVHLDSGLVSDGAKYDIVHTKMFDQLQVTGLARALSDSVKESLAGQKPRYEYTPMPDVDPRHIGRRMHGMAF